MYNVVERQGKQASVSLNDDFFWITTMSGRGLVFFDPETKPIICSADASNEQLGALVLEALSRSRVLPSQEFQEIFNSKIIQKNLAQLVAHLMKEFHYKTKQSMYKSMKTSNIMLNHGIFEMSVTKRKGMDGFTGLAKEYWVVMPENSSAAEIGTAVRLALSRCL